jgi:hypothetical protein
MAAAQWLELGLFVATVLSVALYGLALSGHFPAEHRGQALRSTAGAILLWGTLAVSAAAALGALRFAWMRLPVPATVIGAGFAVLFAPLLLQPLPDRFVDGRTSLLVFSLAALVLAAVGWARMG